MWQVKALPVSARKGMQVESITELSKTCRAKRGYLFLIDGKHGFLFLFDGKCGYLFFSDRKRCYLFLFDESIVSTYSSSMKAYLFILFRQKVLILILIR